MRYLLATLLVSPLVILSGCDQPAETPPPPPAPVIAPSESPELLALQEQYRAISDNLLRRLSVTATGFGDSITGLLDDPNQERLETAQQAWGKFYGAFNQARVILECRAQGSSADAERLRRSDLLPILPGYIDSLHDWPGSGIVNDVTVDLSRESLLEQQGATSELEASLGFQVIHFLLFGEPGHPRQPSAFVVASTDSAGDTVASEAAGPAGDIDADTDSSAADGAGEADDHGHETAMELEDQPARRRQYLTTATSLLVEDTTLLARDDAATNNGIDGSQCPSDALRQTTARLVLLANLQDAHSVAGDYVAADALALSRQGLHEAMKDWLQEKSAWIAWAKTVLPDQAGEIDNLFTNPPGETDVQSLQQLHALLSSLAR